MSPSFLGETEAQRGSAVDGASVDGKGGRARNEGAGLLAPRPPSPSPHGSTASPRLLKLRDGAGGSLRPQREIGAQIPPLALPRFRCLWGETPEQG